MRVEVYSLSQIGQDDGQSEVTMTLTNVTSKASDSEMRHAIRIIRKANANQALELETEATNRFNRAYKDENS